MILSIILAYLMGSIPTAVWYGRIFHGIDVREHGSGNAGATNSLRTLGKKAGIIVLIVDFLKGFLAVKAAGLFMSDITQYLYLLMGLAVIMGHIFPIFAQFKGGKGVATSMGVLVATFPWAALGCFLVFLVIVLATKYVSLGSILGGLAFPIQLMFNLWNDNADNYAIGFAWVVFLILTIMHRQNISRLINGTENKFGAKK
ncbi:Glycerol-3-phosphate acyltransferase [Emticicia oligotrophica DSM 17448]|uniref:Glycerol-3-phosphate acyltransferase n=1 Tax=Emticicia oligotrophica (strain DSM 17448 / CIP 109782 / MTCC 6937 / GPTSA100-15) TaxID=929562 RepID=A0ABM5MZW6_EMTOG|nr:glycerol-3-phosphate 1-O-acyltransferase PlsY [Emticicia oligotrophica]AFK02748.1 Glycerol-3-phosphate acyltransferase [Emticicia oligotrophica DSM 17448]